MADDRDDTKIAMQSLTDGQNLTLVAANNDIDLIVVTSYEVYAVDAADGLRAVDDDTGLPSASVRDWGCR